MVFLMPFQADLGGKIRTIYAVNVENPNEKGCRHITLSEQCPHCKDHHFYRVYDPIEKYVINGVGIERYISMCPSCKNIFFIDIDFEPLDV